VTTPSIAWPQKTHELQNVLFDSTRWNNFEFRDDDIIVATWAKSGTTWTQQILGELIFHGNTPNGLTMEQESPWLDLRLFPIEELFQRLEAQTHRRFIKTHLPLDALVFSPRAKYLYIGRDLRDVAWSWYNHMHGFSDEAFEVINNLPGRVGPPLKRAPVDIVEYFREWLVSDGFPLSDFWLNYQSWFDARHLPNVLTVHFNGLKSDLAGEMRRIAGFLGIEVEEGLWPVVVEHCTFDYMKKMAAASPILGQFFKGGGGEFIYRGTNGRWRDILTPADIDKYEGLVKERLAPDCAHWMATGEIRG
jgi:aryl sulfotransferase